MVAAGEIMAQFVSEQNRQQRDCKRQSREKQRWIPIRDGKGLQQCVERSGLIMGVGGSEMSASDQGSNQRKEKQADSEE